jgi:hypothetical protein
MLHSKSDCVSGFESDFQEVEDDDSGCGICQ